MLSLLFITEVDCISTDDQKREKPADDQKRGKAGKNQDLEPFQRLAMILFRGERNERKQHTYRSHRSPVQWTASVQMTKKGKNQDLEPFQNFECQQQGSNFRAEENDRQIMVIYDPEGSNGKTVFCT